MLLLSALTGQGQSPTESSGPPMPTSVATSLSVGAGNDDIGPVKLRNESVDQVLDLLERWTGRVLLRPTALPAGSYTLTINHPVKREEAIRALETLLTLNGIALAPQGDRFIKVVPLSLARTESPLYIEGSARDLPASGRIASKLFTPQFLRISEFLPQISALLNPGVGAAPVAFEKANSALIVDSVSNLQRIESLLEKLDRPFLENNLTAKFYPLSSAKASNVVNQLRTLLGGPLQMQFGATTTYQADDRTNQIILISDPRQQPIFDDLISKLDIVGDPNTRNEVMFLKNASAKDIATLLSQLVQGRNASAGSGAQSARGAAFTPSTAAAGGAQTPTVAAVAASIGSIEGQDFSELLTILAEERSNSLIVSGTSDDIRLIRSIVEKVDVLLSQVRIEVVIAEVTLNDEATSGISALGLNVRGNKLVGFSGIGAGTIIDGGTLTPDGGGGTDLAMDIKLATTPRKNNTVILSQPAITTTHNKEASIFVGEQRPVVSGFLSDTSGGGGINSNLGRTTVTQTEIGIRLTVKPLIGNDGSVQLEIAQDVSDVIGEVAVDGNPQPVIGKRETKSFVSVRSGEIIVLGGLQRTSKGKTSSRLGPLPFIGDLLGTRKRTDNRTDLVFFLRPYVLTNTPADNVDAYRRLESGQQRDAVREAIGPSFRPYLPPDVPPADPQP